MNRKQIKRWYAPQASKQSMNFSKTKRFLFSVLWTTFIFELSKVDFRKEYYSILNVAFEMRKES
jgi:hypothetical protein